jgi:alkanesulfonate monooxygenase SsuD/methylene tetrahydromethanopterin reductase-like flavin-dependent oxidoreductase (luciferase family)
MSKPAKQFAGEIGIHFPLHVLNRYSLPELIGLAESAWKMLGQFGFSQVWTNDNLEYRSVLASSAAIVARLPVKLGTAVTVPYFRNPVDLAMAFATISELTDGREISLGLGPGSRSILTHQVERVKPLAIMAELATALRTLFAGATLRTSEIPVLAAYFHMNAEQYALRFKTQSPIRLYYGPSLLKSAVLDLIARHFDGVILQTLYGIADMEASLARLQSARSRSVLAEPLRKVMRQAYAENRGVDYAVALTPDQAVDRLIIAGTPAQCTERIVEMFSLAARDEFTQITLGVPLGPDIPEVIDLWGKEILPALR